MCVRDRLKAYLKHKKISQGAFAESIGASAGYVNAISKGIGTDKMPIIRAAYSDLNIDWLLTGEGPMLKDNNTGATQKDNTITNSTNTQAKMDQLSMALDYIGTLKEQLAKMTAIVENQNAVIERLSQKGDDEVLSRRLGAVEERQDELTNKP